jgi:hypothetical protein
LSLLYYIVYSKLTNKLTGPSLELYGIQPTMVGIYNNVKLDVELYGNANIAQQSTMSNLILTLLLYVDTRVGVCKEL